MLIKNEVLRWPKIFTMHAQPFRIHDTRKNNETVPTEDRRYTETVAGAGHRWISLVPDPSYKLCACGGRMRTLKKEGGAAQTDNYS